VCSLHSYRQYAVFTPIGSLAQQKTPFSATGKVVSPPQPWFETFHFLFRIDSIAQGPLLPLKGLTIACTAPSIPPQFGRLYIDGFYSPPRLRRNPYEYDDFNAMMAKGVWGYVEAREMKILPHAFTWIERLSIAFRGIATRALRKIHDYDYRAVLQASFLGDTEFLSPYIKGLFRASGIYHLIAISGLNTAMLTAALYFLLRLLPLGRRTPHFICIAALWLYLLFIGMIPSLFRATVMATLVIVSLVFERKNYAMHTLGLAGAIWLTLSPISLFSPGYQLSFAATAALLTLFPVLYRYLPPIKNHFARPIAIFLFTSLCISVASFCATLPILVYHFGTVSWFGIVANLIAVAAMTVSMWAFFAALLIETFLPFLTFIPLWIAERFLDIVTGTGALALRFPASQSIFPSPWPELYGLFALFLIICATIRRERFGRFCLYTGIAALCLIPADAFVRNSIKTAEVVHFAIPDNDLIGMQWPDHRVWLFCGSINPSLENRIERQMFPWLRHHGATRFSTVVVPKTGRDEISRLSDSLAAFKTAAIIEIPASVSETLDNNDGENVDTIQYYPCAECTCSVIANSDHTDIRIAALGIDTVFNLEYREKQRRKNKRANQTHDAIMYRFSTQGITHKRLWKPTHPLFYQPLKN